MQQVVTDGLSGKKAAAEAVDPKEKPGLGPEVEEKARRSPALLHRLACRRAALRASSRSVAIGGPLSLLAMLFPAVFGGLTGQFKRWMAVISVVSLNSTLLWLHDWLPAWLHGAGGARRRRCG